MTEPVDVVRLREAGGMAGGQETSAVAMTTCGHGFVAGTCSLCAGRAPLLLAQRGPWTEESVVALLDTLQRLTDAVERGEARQETLERALKARGSL